jgi:hypothetical protein
VCWEQVPSYFTKDGVRGAVSIKTVRVELNHGRHAASETAPSPCAGPHPPHPHDAGRRAALFERVDQTERALRVWGRRSDGESRQSLGEEIRRRESSESGGGDQTERVLRVWGRRSDGESRQSLGEEIRRRESSESRAREASCVREGQIVRVNTRAGPGESSQSCAISPHHVSQTSCPNGPDHVDKKISPTARLHEVPCAREVQSAVRVNTRVQSPPVAMSDGPGFWAESQGQPRLLAPGRRPTQAPAPRRRFCSRGPPCGGTPSRPPPGRVSSRPPPAAGASVGLPYERKGERESAPTERASASRPPPGRASASR